MKISVICRNPLYEDKDARLPGAGIVK
jgi:hypothetical protein